MKKLLLLLAFVLSLGFVKGQDARLFTNTVLNDNYTLYKHQSKNITLVLADIVSDDYFTAVQFCLTINTNAAGRFIFSRDISLYGDFGKLQAKFLYANGKQYDLDTSYNYSEGSKKQKLYCTLVFERIPAGIKYISYTDPTNHIFWENVTVPNNPETITHTSWTQASLKKYWKDNGCNHIEGIYTFLNTDDPKWWGDAQHTLAVVKNNDEYDVIYLKGSNKAVWQEGDIKARFTATSIKGLYKASEWYLENKMERPNFYMQFDSESLNIYEKDEDIHARFLKIYPYVDELPTDTASSGTDRSSNNSGNGNSGNHIAQNKPEHKQNNFTVKSQGSGVVVSSRGVVATNNHVIKDANKIEIVIRTSEKINIYKAKVLCRDEANDLALLIIDDDTFTAFDDIPYNIPLTICDVGTYIFAMGYPVTYYLGEEVKITDGIISSKTGYQGDINTYQISAPINPGNSGGPLFDKNGNLVGITNSMIPGADNIGYALKASYLCNLIQSAPISIAIPNSNILCDQDLPSQIKSLSNFVAFIKVY